MNAIFSRFQSRHFRVEDSVPLRAVTTAMALTGVLTAMALTESPWWLALLSAAGCLIGSFVSYKRRYANNVVVKIWISVGILIVLFSFFNQLLLLANANISDARVPLTKLLMALIALHCFDLPRRRDLSVSALVGVTLMIVASTLSRDLFYSWFLAAFMVLAVFMFQLDCASRSCSRARLWTAERHTEELKAADMPVKEVGSCQSFSRQDLRQCLAVSVLVILATFVCFALLPRIRLNLQQFKFSGTLPYQLKMFGERMHGLNQDDSGKDSSKAYNGFSDELDTNYRGSLGDEVVLRVSSNNGTYLRGMAYDKFDGKIWRLSHPKQVVDTVAGPGNCFDLNSRLLSAHVRYKAISQEIFVEEDSSKVVLCANIPYQIYFPASNLGIDANGSIRSHVGVKKDMVYTVFSRIPFFDYAAMRRLPELSADEAAKVAANFSDYLQLPLQLSPEVSRISAREAGRGDNFARAERLCSFLQRHFSYDLNVEPSPLDTDSVSDFLLQKKRGSCEHFASALVIMCRTQGIPAILVSGYQPGQYNPFTGLWEVHLNESHSWAEIYVHEYGWVPLDPTPDSLMKEQPYQDPQSVFSYLAQVLEPLGQQLANSAFFLALGKALQAGFVILSSTWLGLSKYFQQLLSLAVVGAVLCTIAAFRGQFKASVWKGFGFQNKSGSNKEGQQLCLEEATNLFMTVSRSLKYIGLERRQSETAAELLARVEEKLLGSRMESREYLSSLSGFLDLYSLIRFGFGSPADLERLRQLSQALDKMALDLSKQRKTVGIS